MAGNTGKWDMLRISQRDLQRAIETCDAGLASPLVDESRAALVWHVLCTQGPEQADTV